MKVSSNTINNAAAGLEGTKAKSEKATVNNGVDVTKQNPSQSAAKVNLSERAQQMATAKSIASEGINDIDEARVAHFQKLIDSGEYKVDIEKLADKIVDEHLLSN